MRQVRLPELLLEVWGWEPARAAAALRGQAASTGDFLRVADLAYGQIPGVVILNLGAVSSWVFLTWRVHDEVALAAWIREQRHRVAMGADS